MHLPFPYVISSTSFLSAYQLKKILCRTTIHVSKAITAPPTVCAPAVIGVLAVWRQNKTKNQKKMSIAGVPSSRALLGFPMTAPPPVCVPDLIGALAVCIQNKTKKNQVFPTSPLPPLAGLRPSELALPPHSHPGTNHPDCLDEFTATHFAQLHKSGNTLARVWHTPPAPTTSMPTYQPSLQVHHQPHTPYHSTPLLHQPPVPALQPPLTPIN